MDIKKLENELSKFIYELETEDLVKKSEQKVWEKVLFDLKQEQGSRVLLIPIAVDQEVVSLDYLLRTYTIDNFPVVIINEDQVISDLKTVEELEVYLE